MTVQEEIKKLADNGYLQLKETICMAVGQLIDSYTNSQPQPYKKEGAENE